jgi:hypothetical protein
VCRPKVPRPVLLYSHIFATPLPDMLAKGPEFVMIKSIRSSTARKVVVERDRKAEESVSPAVPWVRKRFR